MKQVSKGKIKITPDIVVGGSNGIVDLLLVEMLKGQQINKEIPAITK